MSTAKPDKMTKPPWLRAKFPSGPDYAKVRKLIADSKLHTVCESANCPNLGECWSRGTATLMILGEVCTRACGFCAVKTGRPTELDVDEPQRVAEAVRIMDLRHCVLTSVARDELPDGGAAIWAATIRAVRHAAPATKIEVLIPNFLGREACLDTVLDAKPDILNHNLETVERLQRRIRAASTYDGSLELLRRAKARGFTTKTGIMLGIGEREDEIDVTLRAIAATEVDILTLGQYLQPSARHLPIDRWVTPGEFAAWKERALELGIAVVESGPLVRSSYHADEQSIRFSEPERAAAVPTGV